MPRGPKGEKRPADLIGAAVMVGKIVTGEIEEHPTKRLPKRDRRVSVKRAKKAAGRLSAP